MTEDNIAIFRPGVNCWRVEKADYLSIVVDYGNYYRDLRESIIKARHSIFILGWDIDSRIELLRGEDAEHEDIPVIFYDLICWKARHNPEVQIYLNKWNHSIFFSRQRELFWERKWRSTNLPNIHFCLDGMIPMGACHHQKVAVIDDETAYWGGMDVALGRWDFREHHVKNYDRADPSGLPNPDKVTHFSPYHDIQAVMAGPSATALARLVRNRWNDACDTEPLPLRQPDRGDPPFTWPDSDPPDFENVKVALARTIPAMQGQPATEEIYRLFLDEIAKAEEFIYIENQFLCCDDIAKAINKRLHERPRLRVLALSCREPQGIMERKSMWGGRVQFRDLIEKGGVADRVLLTFTSSRENNEKDVVRIHSKLMIVDDKWMHLGSANINNRSMGMDTECDVTIIGSTEAARKKIVSVRNDLIREHCGWEIEDIQKVIENNEPVSSFLNPLPTSTQHLHRINDELYRKEKFIGLARLFADPRHPILHSRMTIPFHHGRQRRQLQRTLAVLGAVLVFALLMSSLWKHTPLADWVTAENLEHIFRQAEQSPIAMLWVCVIYIIGGLVFVPVTLMTGAVIIVFGGMKGFIFSLIGATISSIVGFMVGKWIGLHNLKRISKHTEYALDKISNAGVIGVAIVRTLPIAPFSLINLVFGVSGVPLLTFVLGTILGLLPGKITISLLGDSLSDVVKNPDPENIMYAVFGFFLWLAVMLGCNKFAKNWQDKHSPRQA